MRIRQTFPVSLWRYLPPGDGLVRLTSLVSGEVDADTPIEAARFLMQEHNHLYVDRAEVKLSDGSLWQRDCLLLDGVYDVALWLSFTGGSLPLLLDRVQADSPLLAAIGTMNHYEKNYVVHASVRCPDGSTWRKDRIRIVADKTERVTL
jgi:hypothetical protein